MVVGILIFILSFILIVLSGSRAALIGIVFGMCALFIYKYVVQFSREGKCLFYCSAFIVFLALLYGLYSVRTDSARGRMLVYNVVIDDIIHKPLGNGLVSFRADYMHSQAKYFESNPNSEYSFLAGDTKTAFNELLQTGYELGWIGILLFIISLFYLFSIKIERRNNIRVLKIVLWAMLAYSMFSYPLRTSYGALLWLVIIGLLSGSDTKYISSNLNIRKKIILTLVFIVLLIIITIFQIKRYNAYKIWADINNGNVYEVNDIISSYKRCYPVLKNESLFLLSYADDMYIIGKTAESIDAMNDMCNVFSVSENYIKLGDYYLNANKVEKVVECYVLAKNMVPLKFTPLYKLMCLYEKQGNITMSRYYANQILSKQIKISSEKIEKIKDKALFISKK